MPTRMTFDVMLGSGTRRASPRSGNDPLRILVLGDFSGRSALVPRPDSPPLIERPVHSIDLDNFDKVLARLGPAARVHTRVTDRPSIEVKFTGLEDFHPDSLYRRLDAFAALRELRSRLQDPATFAQAARELVADGSAPPVSEVTKHTASIEDNSTALTERLLGARPAGHFRAPSGLDAIIRRMIEPHIVPDPTAGAPPYLAAVDATAAEIMRSVLGASSFKQLEASWRALRTLVDRLELDESLVLTLLDVSKEELHSDLLGANRPLEDTALHRRLVEGPEGDAPSVLVADFTFGASVEDIHLLAALGAVGGTLGAPVLAAAAPTLLGIERLARHADPRDWTELTGAPAEAWHALRSSPVARWIGLALPRVLLRSPYGKSADEIDAFEFEEVIDTGEHEALLWSNPAFACALLLGRAFEDNGWQMAPGDVLELDDLPAWVVAGESGRALMPCAEYLLGERAIEQLLARGVMPLVSFRDRNACRLARFQSIAAPARPLAGRWLNE